MSSTTSTAPSSSPSNQPVPTNDGRTNIVGIVLGIAGLFIVGVIVYTTWRLKRRRSANSVGHPFSDGPKQGTTIDRAHPAARITPFGSPDGETPRFKHTPGADMRIATRRPDGAWQFSDPQAPFTPTGVSEIDVLPSPSSSTASMLPPRSHRKEREAAREARKEYDRDYDLDLNPPPPAYGYDYGGYINHAKT